MSLTLVAVLAAALSTSVSGQQPKRKPEPYVAPLLPVEQAWLALLTAPPSASGALDAERVYVPLQNATLVALDRETGELLWTSPIDTVLPPTVGPGVLYVATAGEIHAVDAAGGKGGWRTPVEGGVRAPLLLQGRLLLALLERGELIALEAGTGQVVWRRPLDAEAIAQPVQATASTPSADVAGAASDPIRMQADSGSVYLSMNGGRVVSVALADGLKRWERVLPGTLGEPAVARDRVFVGSTNNYFYALDADTGAIEWQWQYGGDVIGAAVDGEVVYVVSKDAIVRAVNRGNGNQRWKREAGTRPVTPPRTFGGVVVITGLAPAIATFVGKGGAAVATWSAPTGAQLQGPPLIDADLKPLQIAMVVITRDGRAIGLRSISLMFRQDAPVPMTVLPGRALPREPRP